MAAKKLLRRKNRKIGQTRKRLMAMLPVFRRVAVWSLPIVLVVLASVAIRNWAGATPRFALQKLLVNSCEHVPAEKILAFIDARMGANLFTIDLESMHQRLLDHPWIKQVRITRRLPDTLIVTLREHEPYALINLGRLYYVDEDGFVFKRLETGDDRDYPLLSGFTSTDFLDGDAAPNKNVERLARAVRLIDVAARLGGLERTRISEVRFDPLSGYSLVLEERGTHVLLGREDFESKLRRFKLIRESLGPRADRLTLVDLAGADHAVIKGLRKVEQG